MAIFNPALPSGIPAYGGQTVTVGFPNVANPAKSSGIPPFTTGSPSTTNGLPSNWHTVVLWVLGAIAMLALADPAPGIATALMLVIILGVLLQNWDVYKAYLGLK